MMTPAQKLIPLAILLSLRALALAESDSEKLFAGKVWPLLQDKCLACHGGDEKKIKAGFDMRTRDGVFKGGDSGEPALVEGQPDRSPLYLAVTRQHADDWKPMPPKENDRLSDEQITLIKQWIAAGAVWPDAARMKSLLARASEWNAADGIQVKTSGGLSADWTNRRYKPENLWEYQPLRKPAVPEIQDSKFAIRNPIDAFIAAKCPPGLAPAPLADRRALIRRATFDLLGLPPTPAEIDDFVNDAAPDAAAFAKVVERLLASPHYGEQWGQHWLDVVRYADSSGFANDYVRGNAWRYRDYVVRTFNTDKPYDEFVCEQIAGDEIDAKDPEKLVATGFLRMGPWELTSMEVPKLARQRFLDDVTQSVGETFLAHAMQCARCHDHKFDPIPTRDYYSLQAIFATTQLCERPAKFSSGEEPNDAREKSYSEQRRDRYRDMLHQLDEKAFAAAREWLTENDLDAAPFESAVQEVQAQAAKGYRELGYPEVRAAMMKKGIPEDQVPPKGAGLSIADFGVERIAHKGLERLRWELDRSEPIALGVYDGLTPDLKFVVAPVRIPQNRMIVGELEVTNILPGGDPFSGKIAVTPAVLSAASFLGAPELSPPSVTDAVEGRRRALAEWIASPRNPLTARVMVNRIWLGHFGRAIAGNPNNFGTTGKKPTHPELLDWLAATFIERGWSMKEMHRLIMNSATYRRSAEYPDRKALAGLDPNGTSYAVFLPRRLTAEELRDAMLSVSGELNPVIGGLPVRPEMNSEAALQPRQVMGTFAEAWQPSPLPAQRNRRSIYTLKIRGQRDPFMEVFNEPSPDFSCERRDASTVTPQVFALFNSEASYARSLALANRVLGETKSREEAMGRLFHLVFGRAATAEEQRACLAHWEAMTERHRGLKFAANRPPNEVVRGGVEENSGEKFVFKEILESTVDFIPDLQAADASPELRGLAEVCLVLLNANEFAYVY